MALVGAITDHKFEPGTGAREDYCTWLAPMGAGGGLSDAVECGAHKVCHESEYRPVILPLRPPVRSDYERALERIQELEAELASSEEERLKAVTRAGDLELRLNESLARESAANTRLNNIDALAREILARAEKIAPVLDIK